LKLGELENNLIAKVILFQKVFKLPKSRMAAVKDKIVNIPIGDIDITKTLQCMPRTPSEAGLIEVKLKRKTEYKNVHQQALIDPNRLYRAVNYLRKSGNPDYQFIDDIKAFETRCKINDPVGSEIIFPTNEGPKPHKSTRKLSVKFIDEKDEIKIMEKGKYLEIIEEETSLKEEIYYRENDPIRKFQIDYDSSVCLTEKFPEAFAVEEDKSKGNQFSFAPGEGKIPQNILTTENWDALAFPMKHPNGKFNLHHKRKRKLSDQYYFVQRLRNKDKQFSQDPAYLFAAAQYIEKKQFQRNINVSFMRGKKSFTNQGEATYKLEDGFSVFDNTSNTPKYWQTAKYEMMAKLNNLGPFAFFFTLSCADMRWNENFTTLLRDRNLKIIYDITGTTETTWVAKMNDGTEVERKLLKHFLEEDMDESFHELIRRNIMIATRNYKNRVDAFMKEIVNDKSNRLIILVQN
jgi:hypothetical protein